MLEKDSENKFATLLNPIRDLADNWCIDIASELEDYLSDLENLTITFDGGATNLNFAEAALLIQGSACVYSKKVEYLYTLVCQVLDHFAERRKTTAAAAAAAADNDDEENGTTEQPQFLPLDDIQECDDEQIDLQEDFANVLDFDSAADVSSADPSDAASANDASRRVSVQSTRSHKSSVQSAQFLQFDVPYNISYEDTATRTSTNYKVNSCAIHSSGALLLDFGDHTLLNMHRFSESNSRLSTASTTNNNINSSSILNAAVDGGSDDEGDINDDSAPPMMTTPNLLERSLASNTSQISLRNRMSATGASALFDALDSERESAAAAAANVTRSGLWEPLDPHSKDSLPRKPYEKKKTWKVPKLPKDSFIDQLEHSTAMTPYSLSLLPISRSSTDTQPQQSKLLGKRSADSDQPIASAPVKQEMGLDSLLENDRRLFKLNRIFHSEFKDIWDIEQKRRRIEKSELKRKSLALHGNDTAANDLFQAHGFYNKLIGGALSTTTTIPTPNNSEPLFANATEIAFNDLAPGLSDDDSDHDGVGDVNGAIHGTDAFDVNVDFDYGNGDGEFGARRMSRMIGGITDNDTIDSVMQSYEDLCRKHLESYMHNAELFAQDSQLTRRVSDWQNKIIPLLETQERKPQYDIHQYSDRIIHSLQRLSVNDDDSSAAIEEASTAESRPIPFAELVVGKDPAEVCRYFLATLQLANHGNVGLQHSSEVPKKTAAASDPFNTHNATSTDLKVALLSAELKHTNLDEYRAPSLRVDEETTANGNEASGSKNSSSKKRVRKQVSDDSSAEEQSDSDHDLESDSEGASRQSERKKADSSDESDSVAETTTTTKKGRKRRPTRAK